jgi:hypothetical protein
VTLQPHCRNVACDALLEIEHGLTHAVDCHLEASTGPLDEDRELDALLEGQAASGLLVPPHASDLRPRIQVAYGGGRTRRHGRGKRRHGRGCGRRRYKAHGTHLARMRCEQGMTRWACIDLPMVQARKLQMDCTSYECRRVAECRVQQRHAHAFLKKRHTGNGAQWPRRRRARSGSDGVEIHCISVQQAASRVS